MMITPKVSVVIPAYNVRSYIKDALTSLERQSLQEFEVLVVDDGSTDDTAEIVKPFCQRDCRFQLLQKQNGGLSSARNYGVRHARTDYIALLDADDVYKPDKLATHIALLDSISEVGVVYSASRAIREDGHPTFIYLSGQPIASDPLIALLYKNFIGHGSNAVFRRCLFDQVGGFNEMLRGRGCEDLDFWLRIASMQHWNFYRLPQTLCCYRVRRAGVSFDVRQMQLCYEHAIENAYRRSPERLKPVLSTAYAYMYRYLARLSITSGDTEQACDFIDRALACDRSIFYRDPRSLLTLASVRLAPLAKFVIKQTLGTAKLTAK
ncbi:glycosyltransferase family 2 protein [Chroococcidiopsis sp. FACHB-1243]|uniref:glycosyltransferase family 2 protein n=1 Tax=Chroococcidiopsis sp. [FACHB-1243] TaxID=2692781 RepID=UPI00177B69CC|nr:glycosyltransferase family 2 protein [Chroococcidiopsis sp. [FACHB-1243]]MBD2304823.1 glycosyltransferase family 2 protein [Chroococcidiopsis sp. [FACHB-1243]]